MNILEARIVDDEGNIKRDSKRGKFLMVSRKDERLVYDPVRSSPFPQASPPTIWR